MKQRIYFRPVIVVGLLGGASALLWTAVVALDPGIVAGFLAALALFYTALFALTAWAMWRISALECWADWDRPRRLLIFAPHEDDCVISAGGIGARNNRLGGATRVVYLARDDTPGMAERRAAEARDAWIIAGLEPHDLMHVDLLPPLRQRDPSRLQAAATRLRAIIDEFRPSAIVVPMFEGGHIHHDMAAALITGIVVPGDRFDVLEAPEYGPYVSLANTPHKVIALAARWLFGLVAYYGPPDGVDGRPIMKYRLDGRDLECKRRMLAAFESQNAPALVATRAYPDRLVLWNGVRKPRWPFDFGHSYLRVALAARRALPVGIVDRLFHVQPGTIGREGGITDWDEETTGSA
jgi:LmbE family N-acetylglucosaminyl deacetylase